jgi:hypothetical protein
MRVRSFLYSQEASGGDGGGEPAAEPVAEASAEVQAETPAADPAPSSEGSNTAPSWSGELEQIAEQPWFSTLPADAQGVVREGLRAKHATWESGYGKKFQEVAELRKTASDEAATLSTDLATLKAAHAAEVRRLRDDAALLADLFGNEDGKAAQEHFDAKLAEREAAYQAERKALESEIGELRTYREASKKQAAEAYEAAVEEEAKRLRTSYADILANEIAAERFERLIRANEDEVEAAAYVREKFIPKAPKVPAAAVNAAAGDGPHASTTAPAGMTMDQRLEWAVNRAAQTLGR